MNSVIVWVLYIKLAGMYAGSVEISFPTEQACEQARNGVVMTKVIKTECNPRKEK